MKIPLFFILCVLLVIPSVYGLFKPLDFTGNVILKGISKTNTVGSPNIDTNNVTLVLDSKNERIFFDLGGGGKYWIFRNYSVVDLLGVCTILKNWNYTSQVVGYSTAFSSNILDSEFIGEVRDVGSCNDPVFVKITKLFGVGPFVEFDFQQIFPLPPNPQFPNGICLQVNAIQTYTSIDYFSSRAPFFNLPPACLSPNLPEYCDVFYPSGNACENFYD